MNNPIDSQHAANVIFEILRLSDVSLNRFAQGLGVTEHYVKRQLSLRTGGRPDTYKIKSLDPEFALIACDKLNIPFAAVIQTREREICFRPSLGTLQSDEYPTEYLNTLIYGHYQDSICAFYFSSPPLCLMVDDAVHKLIDAKYRPTKSRNFSDGPDDAEENARDTLLKLSHERHKQLINEKKQGPINAIMPVSAFTDILKRRGIWQGLTPTAHKEWLTRLLDGTDLYNFHLRLVAEPNIDASFPDALISQGDMRRGVIRMDSDLSFRIQRSNLCPKVFQESCQRLNQLLSLRTIYEPDDVKKMINHALKARI